MANESLTVTVEESSGGIEPGDTVTGVIKGTQVREWESDDGPVLYYDINIEEESVGLEFKPSYSAGPKDNPRVTDKTLLGQIVQTFGHELSKGSSIELDEVFATGTRVEFEVEGRTYEDDAGNEQQAIDANKETLRPAGAEAPSIDTGSAQDDESDAESDAETDAVADEVREIVAQNEGEGVTSIKSTLVKKSGDHLRAFNQMRDSGDVLVSDEDEVFLSE